MDKVDFALLGLLRCSLGASPEPVPQLEQLSCDEWKRLIAISFSGGVAALAVDGYNALLANEDGDLVGENNDGNILETDETLEDLKFEWFGSVLQAEDDYRVKFSIASRFAKALSAKGVSCQVLKGMSFATYYPKPSHRECGDCDVYLSLTHNAPIQGVGHINPFEAGNNVVVELGGRHESGTYKHSHLFLGRLMIENHRYLTDFNGTRQGKFIELLLERAIAETNGREILASDYTESALICPNDHFNALFLIKHAHGNFIYEGLSLRMVYDWAAMLLHCGHSLDWKRLYAELEECRLRKFADVMTSMCVEYLGVDIADVPITLCQDSALVEEIMGDTISGGLHANESESFLKKCLRIVRRFARIYHYRSLATESFPRMMWNNFAFSSYMKRNIEL